MAVSSGKRRGLEKIVFQRSSTLWVRTTLAVAILFIATGPANGQERFGSDRGNVPMDPTPRHVQIGGYAAAAWNKHQTSFGALEGIPNCCTHFLGNYSTGFALGLLGEISLDEAFSGELRIGFRREDVRLHEENFIGNAIIGNDAVPAYSEHRIDAHLHMLEFTPLLKYRLIRTMPLDLSFGPTLGILLSPSFEQSETLVRPQGITFSDGSVVRNRFSGALPNAAILQPALTFSVGTSLFLSPTLEVSPELRCYLPLNSVVRDLAWRAYAVTGGVAVRLRPSIRGNAPPENVPAAIPASPPHTARLTAHALLPDGKRAPAAVISVKETQYMELFPILPYVFFPSGSAELGRTRQHLLGPAAAPAFDERRLPREPLPIYAELLNIIGSRLRARPDATVQIIGCNNTLRVESETRELSGLRAIAVRDYLLDVWGIPLERITLLARDLPMRPTQNETVEGQVENRRVEIRALPADLLSPVRVEEEEMTESVPQAEFLFISEPRLRLSSWNFHLYQDGRLLAEEQGEDSIPALLWNPGAELPLLTDNDIIGVLQYQDEEGRSDTLRASLPVQMQSARIRRFEMRDRMRLERFGLILFDFDKSDLGEMNLGILDSVRSRIAPASVVKISGYADCTGSAAHNARLADERCRAVREHLADVLYPDRTIVEAVGSDELLFDNSLPEGRQLNRIVYITVATPVP